MIPSPGRIVLYRLNESDANQVNAWRAAARGSLISDAGTVVHQGNKSRRGDVLPMLIVRVWAGPEQASKTTSVQGQVFLDGNDNLWVTSRQQGDGEGNWFEPPRVRPSDPHLIPDTTGDLEPTTPDEVVLLVQFSASGAAEITGEGMEVPDGTVKVQLVKQPNGVYGLRFISTRPL